MIKKRVFLVCSACLACLAAISAFLLVKELVDRRTAQNEFFLLRGAHISQAQPFQRINERDDDAIIDYQALYRQNKDMVGWLKVPGTAVDYPVMQTPGKPNFYLDHDFAGNESKYGVPYAAENCDVFAPSDNIIIHGHHMKDGSMFAGLSQFEKKDFYDLNNTVYFDTLAKRGVYKIVCVFKTTAYDQNGFAYYDFINAADAENFDAFIAACKALSLYDTGEGAEYGDKLICLSTCEYSSKNGRLIIVAKQI